MTSKTSRPLGGERAKTRPSTGNVIGSSAIRAVIDHAHDMGLLLDATQQVGARLPTKLLEQAKKRTGIDSTTDLLAFALANVAVEDDFAAAFAAARGRLETDLDIGF